MCSQAFKQEKTNHIFFLFSQIDSQDSETLSQVFEFPGQVL